MVYPATHRLLAHIRRMAHRPADAALLHQFVEQHDEAAFAGLMDRHARLVWGVCRRVLGHTADAEDAFQATFLVLARKARAIAKKESLPSWLHGVAYRVANKLRRGDTARRQREERVPPREASGDLEELTWREVRQVLDEELARLPDKYRLPLVLCYLQGKTQDEAARELGLGIGVFRGRLDRGREQLRRRLLRRDIGLAAALAATLAAEGLAQAAVPARLMADTLRAAMHGASGKAAVSAAVTGLADMVLRGMARAKATSAAVLLAFGCLIVGVGWWGLQAAAEDEPAAREVAKLQPPPAKPQTRVDVYGDPLPPDAIGRIGTVRLRCCGNFVFAKDGRALISADDTLKFWNTATGALSLGAKLPKMSAHLLGLSPDGTMLATGGEGGSINLIGMPAGKHVGQLKRNGGPPDSTGTYCVSFSPDGRFLASRADDQIIRLWDVENRRPLREFGLGPNFAGQNIAFSSDGKTIVAASRENAIREWDVATGKLLREIGRMEGHVSDVVLSPDGKTLAAGDWSGHLRVWDLAAGKLLHQLAGFEHGVFTLSFSPDGRTLAAGGGGRLVRFWDVATGKPTRQLDGNWDQTNHLAYSPDGRTLAAAGAGNVTRIWDTGTGKELVSFAGHQGWLFSTALSPDGKFLATSSQDGTVRLWNVATRKEVRRLPDHAGWVERLAFSPDGKLLASAGRDAVVRVSEVASGQLVRQFKGNRFSNPVAFSPDGKLLAAGSAEKHVCVWDLATGDELARLDGSTIADRFSSVLCLAFSPDGQLLAFGGNDGTNGGYVRLCHWRTPGLFRDFRHGQLARSVVFSPNGRTLAAGHDDAFVLWEVATGKERCRVPKAKAGVSAIALSPDGRLLASSGYDHRAVAIWDLELGKPRQVLRGHQDGVPSVTFSPDGKVLASASYDTTVLLWGVNQHHPAAPSPASATTMEELWNTLAGDDAAKAFRVIWDMSSRPSESVAWINSRVQPVAPPDGKEMARLIGDLESGNFSKREAASRKLDELGDQAEPALRKALAAKPALEASRRISAILENRFREPPAPSVLRAWRAVEVLELIGTAEAQQALGRLAAGAEECRMTRDAKAALDRLTKRAATP